MAKQKGEERKMYYALIETEGTVFDFGDVMSSIVMCSKNKAELEELKLLLEKKYAGRVFEIVEL